MEATTQIGWGKAPLRWGIILFFAATHILAIAGIVHLVVAFSWWTLGLGILWYFFCGLSVTAGYHRLFSHRTDSGPSRRSSTGHRPGGRGAPGAG